MRIALKPRERARVRRLARRNFEPPPDATDDLLMRIAAGKPRGVVHGTKIDELKTELKMCSESLMADAVERGEVTDPGGPF
jgi:hypothetical protein